MSFTKKEIQIKYLHSHINTHMLTVGNITLNRCIVNVFEFYFYSLPNNESGAYRHNDKRPEIDLDCEYQVNRKKRV